MFKIVDHVEFDAKGRGCCPCCESEKGKPNKNLSLVPETDGAYKCFRGCLPTDIRNALGADKPKQVPQSQARSTVLTCTPQEMRKDCDHLTLGQGEIPEQARQWLLQRGILGSMMASHCLGLRRIKVDKQMAWAISIPIPANADKTAYYRKYRVMPWAAHDLSAWQQYGVPSTVLFTHKPENAGETWLCEGEWDAIRLAQVVRDAGLGVAVATFTSGCSSYPNEHELARLPGKVSIFYDRNDDPNKNGDRPGEVGAKKLAKALGDRAIIRLVPGTDEQVNAVKGWDVSNALDAGYKVDDFRQAQTVELEKKTEKNPLKDRLVWNDDLLSRAPDYTEWLVPDILTANELYMLAAGARTGKSLLSMTLSLAVATGSEFLGRPVTQGTVLYVNCEDPEGKIKEREQAQGWGAGLPVAWIDKFKLNEVAHLKELVKELDPRLLVLDTLSRIRDGSISESSAEISQQLEPLQELAKEMEVCVLLVHHTNKINHDNAAEANIFDTIRGSTAIRAVCRGSMILAAAERDYRLVVENGWGKHDFKVVLDANTLTWRLLGKWSPATNLSQQDQIVDCLKKLGKANLEQIHEFTGIPKKSLYEQLARLQASQTADVKIVKEGARRSYLYRLALFNSIQQLNSLLNSGNADADNNRVPIQQNNIFSSTEQDQQKSVTPPMIQNADPNPTPLTLLNCGISPANSHLEADLPIQQIFNKTGFVEYKSPNSTELDQPTGTQPLIQPEKVGSAPIPTDLEAGDPVWVLHGDRWTEGQYVRVTNQQIVCSTAPGLHPAHLVLVHGERARFTINELRRRS